MADFQESLEILGLPLTGTGELLSDGPVSRCWKIVLPDAAVVLRQDKPLARQMGLDREREWRNLQQAWSVGLAPQPLRHVPESGLLLTAFCEGMSWDKDPEHSWAAHGRLLARLHSSVGLDSNAGSDCLDPLAAGECYARVSQTAESAPLLVMLADLWNLLKETVNLRLCHNDAHRGNVIGGQSPCLIDWEYSAWADPLFDLAVVWRYHGLSAPELELFLSAYGLSVDRERLELWAALYDCLSQLWVQAIRAGTHPNGIR